MFLNYKPIIMEIDLQKAKEYYSNLSDLEIINFLKSQRSDLNPTIKDLLENILQSRGVDFDHVFTEIDDIQSDTPLVKSKFSWWMVISAYSIVLIITAIEIGGREFHPYSKEFGFVLLLARATGSALLPIIVMFMIKYPRRKKIDPPLDIKEVLFYGFVVTIVILGFPLISR